jgi:hypothetical protein
MNSTATWGEQGRPQQEFKWRHFLGHNDPKRIVRDRDRSYEQLTRRGITRALREHPTMIFQEALWS